MREKRGQVTIFIIIAIVIIGLGVLAYVFYPRIKSTITPGEENPPGFIQSCLEEEIENAVEKLSLQGGSIDPVFYTFYDNKKVEYLCYTGEYFKTGVIQQPMLKQHIEEEIKNEIKGSVEKCFDSLEDTYRKRGYAVELQKGETKIELLPNKIVSAFDYPLTLTRTSPETYDSFSVVVNNNLYELISIGNSILEWEAYYGDADVTSYMAYYHDLKVEKKDKSDGSKIYIISDRNTGNKFQFASRSVVLPPGYGL